MKDLKNESPMYPITSTRDRLRKLGEHFRYLRSVHNFTQEEFCERAGMSRSQYQRIENGQLVDLKISTIWKIQDVYARLGIAALPRSEHGL